MAQKEIKDSLPVTPDVIKWARENAGFSLDEAQKTFKKIADWEAGKASPSYPQLELLAEKFKCPVAVFFFPARPDVPSVKQSFRTLSDADFEQIPRTVRSFLRKGQAMQLNLAEINEGKNPAPRLITREMQFGANTTVEAAATKLREYIGVSFQEQASWSSLDEAMEKWREAFARVGVFVFKDAFHAKSYFGFCLYDNEFPIIYVNNSSTRSRQIFTLFHELGHLLFHTSGIDILDDQFIEHLPENAKKIEILCNRLAAKFLMPDMEFDKALGDKKPTRDTAALLAEHFNVSREAVYRRFLDRGLIDPDEYRAAADAWAAQMKKSGGGDYYNSQMSYLGWQYMDLAFSGYYQRRYDENQLSDYLNIKPKSLPELEMRYGARR